MAMASTITTRGGPWPINSRTKVAPAPINEKYPHLLLDAGGESRVPGSTTRRAFEAKRSEKLFRVLEYNWIICPIGLVCCFVGKKTASRSCLQSRTLTTYSILQCRISTPTIPNNNRLYNLVDPGYRSMCPPWCCFAPCPVVSIWVHCWGVFADKSIRVQEETKV
jgi:hypothetical protein